MASKFEIVSSSNLQTMGNDSNEVGGWHQVPHTDVVEVVCDMLAYNASGDSVHDLNMKNLTIYSIVDVERQLKSLNSPTLSMNMNIEFIELDVHEQAMVRNVDCGTFEGDGCEEEKLEGSQQQ